MEAARTKAGNVDRKCQENSLFISQILDSVESKDGNKNWSVPVRPWRVVGGTYLPWILTWKQFGQQETLRLMLVWPPSCHKLSVSRTCGETSWTSRGYLCTGCCVTPSQCEHVTCQRGERGVAFCELPVTLTEIQADIFSLDFLNFRTIYCFLSGERRTVVLCQALFRLTVNKIFLII